MKQPQYMASWADSYVCKEHMFLSLAKDDGAYQKIPILQRVHVDQRYADMYSRRCGEYPLPAESASTLKESDRLHIG